MKTQEKEWRESCERVDEFNHKFWYENNSMFIKAKADYEEECNDTNAFQTQANFFF